ncbi:MAG: hypothetical protein IKP92_01470 [Lachnospiraceae bacterium]|nr:hypothetical protein [Lachnospiraceae bacterium]
MDSDDLLFEEMSDDEIESNKEKIKKRSKENRKEERKNKKPPIFLIIVAVIILAIIGLVIFLAKRWEGSGEFYIDTSLDTETETDDRVMFFPADFYRENDDGVITIMILGNDTFGKNLGGPSVARLLQANTKATIVDCTFPGSTMMAHREGTPEESGYKMDHYSLYWLFEAKKNGDLSKQKEMIGDMDVADKTVYQEHLENLEKVDMETVDYLLICYDAHDYLMGHPVTNEVNEYSPTCMNGVIYGLSEKIGTLYPELQVAYVSPSFCYVTDDEGNRTGGNVTEIKGRTLSDMIMGMKMLSGNYGASYVDDYFGVKINEETAGEYLTEDDVVPNLEGKKLIASHILNRVFKMINAL